MVEGTVRLALQGLTLSGQPSDAVQVQDRTRQVIQVSKPSLALPSSQLVLTEQNLEAVLAGAGMSLKNVVKANIYLSNLSRDFSAVNEVSFLRSHVLCRHLDPGSTLHCDGQLTCPGVQGDDA